MKKNVEYSGIARRRWSNYILILDLAPGFNILHKDNS